MCVSVSNLHFPQMNLASEKPPEAVLEGVILKIFLGEHAPRPPYIMVCFACHPSSHREIWTDRFCLASYGRACICTLLSLGVPHVLLFCCAFSHSLLSCYYRHASSSLNLIIRNNDFLGTLSPSVTLKYRSLQEFDCSQESSTVKHLGKFFCTSHDFVHMVWSVK